MPFDIFSILQPIAIVLIVITVIWLVQFVRRSIRNARQGGHGQLWGFASAILKLGAICGTIVAAFGMLIVLAMVGIHFIARYGGNSSAKKGSNTPALVQNAAYAQPEASPSDPEEPSARPVSPLTVEQKATPPAVREPKSSVSSYPIQGLQVKNFQKFEVITRGNAKVHFFGIDGAYISHTQRIVDDEKGINIWTPDKPDAYAIIYPIMNDAECEYQTKSSGGKFAPCRRDGPMKFGMENWGFRFAYHDSQ